MECASVETRPGDLYIRLCVPFKSSLQPFSRPTCGTKRLKLGDTSLQSSNMRLSVLGPIGIALLSGSPAAASYVNLMSKNAKSLFTESMAWMDDYYDAEAGYLYDFSAATALRHETRSSVWYAFGLLARNKAKDAAEAEKIIQNVIHGQYKNPAEEW